MLIAVFSKLINDRTTVSGSKIIVFQNVLVLWSREILMLLFYFSQIRRMKLLVVTLACVLSVAFCALPNKILSAPEAEMWKAWKHKYNKEYDSMVEEVSRFDVWLKKVKEVCIMQSFLTES